MHSGLAKRLAFPTALFNQPPGGYFHLASVYGIMRHIAEFPYKLFVFVFIDNRIRKETACITFNGRVRKLSLAYLDYDIPHLCHRRGLYAPFPKFRENISIFKTRHKHVGQFIRNVSYHISIFPFALEFAPPVRITALVISELMFPARLYVYRFYLCY